MSTSIIPVITVDGPSGVGKGTISHLLAQHYGWHFLDSGALYRLLALAAVRGGIALDDTQRVTELARHLDVEFLADTAGNERILLNKQDVTSDIRTEQAGNNASRVAVIPEVREALLQRQRDFAQPPGLIADGRDMGTTVFPDAAVKIFLTASAQVRAERRYKQLKEKGFSASLTDLVNEIAERDRRDSTRSSSPLKAADDAVQIDTSSLDIAEVFQQVIDICHSRVG